ncbi:UNVERIFIED_CONTAM: hypothetical protein FKN15_052898 [Acipenser sinensis]
MDRNALAELLQALESRRDAEERRREERYTALIERRRIESQELQPQSQHHTVSTTLTALLDFCFGAETHSTLPYTIVGILILLRSVI